MKIARVIAFVVRRRLLTIGVMRHGPVPDRRSRDTYTGIARGVYGRNAEERAAYTRAERESWDRSRTDC